MYVYLYSHLMERLRKFENKFILLYGLNYPFDVISRNFLVLILNQVDIANMALYAILPAIMSLFIWFSLVRMSYCSISQFLIYTPA